MRAESKKSSLWIWPFELEEKIGEGGMGVVYRGRYVKNDRRVAVKLLPENVADETILKRFEREVEILKTLRHPNIVLSFGGVCEDKRRFYAMELVEGGSLESLLKSRGGSLPWEMVVELGLQMCAALDYAHQRGIVHRDIKPGNFLMTKKGTLKLSDFGLATVTSGHKLTASGKTVGSFRYMAPEQVRGRPDPVPQTDLYALGCVLFQMLTGQPPFDGDTAAELLNKQLSEFPPRVSQLVPECPPALDELVDSLLSKSIEDRPASAAEVANVLQRVSLKTLAGADVGRSSKPRRAIAPGGARTTPAAFWSSKMTLILMATVIVSLSAVLYLWKQNQQLQAAEDLWIAKYREGTTEEKVMAADALGKLGHSRPHVVPLLAEGVESDDLQVQMASIRALAESGDAAREYLPLLIKLQRHGTSPLVSSEATEAITQIRSSPRESSFGLGTIAIILIVLVIVGAAGYVLWKRKSAELSAGR